MPSVLIEVRKQYSVKDETEIMDAVHAALCVCFKILPNDRNVRFIAHEPNHFQCPPDKEKPESYIHISIDCFAGRSLDTKRALYKTIVKNLEVFQIPNDHVKIMLREITPDNWGIRGGQAACDVELGYKIDI